MVKEIYEILEEAGYDCDKISDEEWEDLNSEWENECDDFLRESIKARNTEIVLEWSLKCNVEKKDDR